MKYIRILNKRYNGYWIKMHNRRISIIHWPRFGKWIIRFKRYFNWREISDRQIAMTDEAMLEIVRAWQSITADEAREVKGE